MTQASAIPLTLGDAFATVALSLFVLDRTGSGLGVAGVVAAGIVSVLLLRRWLGVVVDRLSPGQGHDLGRSRCRKWRLAPRQHHLAVVATRRRLPGATKLGALGLCAQQRIRAVD